MIKAFLKVFFNTWFEIAYGFAVGALTWFLGFGLWTIAIAVICAILWRLGGIYGHSIRVFGVPAVIVAPHAIGGLNCHLVVFYFAFAIVACFGYSVPDRNQAKASWLGTYYYKQFAGKQPIVDIATRGTIFLAIALTFFLYK